MMKVLGGRLKMKNLSVDDGGKDERDVLGCLGRLEVENVVESPVRKAR